MKKTLLSMLVLVLVGCSSNNLLLIDKNNKEHIVTYNSLTQAMETSINGKKFTGNYVTNSSVAFGTTQNYGKNFHQVHLRHIFLVIQVVRFSNPLIMKYFNVNLFLMLS